MAKTKTVLKTTYVWDLPSKYYQPGQGYAISLKRESYRYFMILSHFVMQKDCQEKHFLEHALLF